MPKHLAPARLRIDVILIRLHGRIAHHVNRKTGGIAYSDTCENSGSKKIFEYSFHSSKHQLTELS